MIAEAAKQNIKNKFIESYINPTLRMIENERKE
jgi:hypothetical protein